MDHSGPLTVLLEIVCCLTAQDRSNLATSQGLTSEETWVHSVHLLTEYTEIVSKGASADS